MEEREKTKAEIAPSEFKLFDSRIDFKVEKKDEFDGMSEKEFEDTESVVSNKEETKQAPATHQSEDESVDNDIEPAQIEIGDNRIDYKIDLEESDKFSQTEVSQAESSEVDGLFEYSKKFDGDQEINAPVEDEELKQDKGVQAFDVKLSHEEQKHLEEKQKIKELVDATISAWSSNPSMVKKQMDQQHTALRLYKDQIADLQYQLSLKTKEIEKRVGIDNIRDLEKKKKELERQNVIILEREKKRVVELRLKEMHELKRENKELEMETRRLKLLLKKYKK